jgi:hypothetical protein
VLSLNNVGSDDITDLPTKLRVIIEEVVVWLLFISPSSTKLLALEMCIFLEKQGAWRGVSAKRTGEINDKDSKCHHQEGGYDDG